MARYSSPKIEKLLFEPTKPDPNQLYLVEARGHTRVYLSDTKSKLHLLNGAESLDSTFILKEFDESLPNSYVLEDSDTIAWTFDSDYNLVLADVVNHSITYTKIQDVTSKRILGRYDLTAGTVQEITVGAGLNLSDDGVLEASVVEGVLTDIEYLLKSPSADLPNARVATDTATVTVDYSTAGDVKWNVPFASTSVHGVTKLDTAPTSSVDPIAVSTTNIVWLAVNESYYLNSYADLATALTAIGTSTIAELKITENCNVTDDTTIPGNIIVTLEAGGKFTVSSGKTLTLKNAPRAPARRIFYGSGTSLILDTAHLSLTHWLDNTVGVTNHRAALKQAIDSCNYSAIKGGYIHIPVGKWYISGLDLYSNITIDGCGMGLDETHTGAEGTTLELISGDTYIFRIDASADSVQYRHNITVKNICLDVYEANAQCVLQEGLASTSPSSYMIHWENVRFAGMPQGPSDNPTRYTPSFKQILFYVNGDVGAPDHLGWETIGNRFQNCIFAGANKGECLRILTENSTFHLEQCTFAVGRAIETYGVTGNVATEGASGSIGINAIRSGWMTLVNPDFRGYAFDGYHLNNYKTLISNTVHIKLEAPDEWDFDDVHSKMTIISGYTLSRNDLGRLAVVVPGIIQDDSSQFTAYVTSIISPTEALLSWRPDGTVVETTPSDPSTCDGDTTYIPIPGNYSGYTNELCSFYRYNEDTGIAGTAIRCYGNVDNITILGGADEGFSRSFDLGFGQYFGSFSAKDYTAQGRCQLTSSVAVDFEDCKISSLFFHNLCDVYNPGTVPMVSGRNNMWLRASGYNSISVDYAEPWGIRDGAERSSFSQDRYEYIDNFAGCRQPTFHARIPGIGIRVPYYTEEAFSIRRMAPNSFGGALGFYGGEIPSLQLSYDPAYSTSDGTHPVALLEIGPKEPTDDVRAPLSIAYKLGHNTDDGYLQWRSTQVEASKGYEWDSDLLTTNYIPFVVTIDELVGSQNNLAFHTTNQIIHISSSTAISITGFTTTLRTPRDGQTHYIWNVGTHNITFTNLDVLSLVGNRLTSASGSDLVLVPKACLTVVRDESIPGWRGYLPAGDSGSFAPEDAEYILKLADSDLPNGRVLTDTTTVNWDYATTGQAKANVVNVAPIDAEYIVKTLSSTLTAERALTDTASITWDYGTANQAQANTAAFTGDITTPAGSTVTTLATVNSNVGIFGSATQAPQVTVNAKGLVTAVSNVTITPAASSITGGAALTRTNDTNVTLTLGGSPTTALLNAASLTLGWTGILDSSRGGTGNGFTKFSGPTTSEKTFTLPNANDTLVAYGTAGTFTAAQTFPNASGIKIQDTDASNTLGIVGGSNLTGNRTLTITTGDASRILTFTADATIGGTNNGDQTITLTGDVTGSGTGSFATTLTNIPTATTMAGYLAATAIAAPSTPAAGIGRIYVDSTSKNIAVKDDAGVVKHGVQTKASVASNFLTAISDAGVVSAAQPAFSDISGTIDLGGSQASGTLAAGRFPALTGDVTTVAGALATTIANNAVVTAKILDANVTYAKIQNVTASSLLGRYLGTNGVTQEISVGSGLNLSVAGVLTATGSGLAPATAEYILKSANGTLTSGRVLTDTASVITDYTTSGLVKLTVPAASTSTYGITKLDTAPTSSVDPIAVGTRNVVWLAVQQSYYINSFANLAAALSQIATDTGGTALAELKITQNCAISATTSIPANVLITLEAGGKITVATGQTLTINSPFPAMLHGCRQAFFGPGNVTLAQTAHSGRVHISLWCGQGLGSGAQNTDSDTGVFGDNHAFAQAITSLSGGGILMLGASVYYCDNQQLTNGIHIRGAGKILDPATLGTKGTVVRPANNSLVSAASSNGIFKAVSNFYDISFEDLTLSTVLSSGTNTTIKCLSLTGAIHTSSLGCLVKNVCFHAAANNSGDTTGTSSGVYALVAIDGSSDQGELVHIKFDNCTATIAGTSTDVMWVRSTNTNIAVVNPSFTIVNNGSLFDLESVGWFGVDANGDERCNGPSYNMGNDTGVGGFTGSFNSANHTLTLTVGTLADYHTGQYITGTGMGTNAFISAVTSSSTAIIDNASGTGFSTAVAGTAYTLYPRIQNGTNLGKAVMKVRGTYDNIYYKGGCDEGFKNFLIYSASELQGLITIETRTIQSPISIITPGVSGVIRLVNCTLFDSAINDAYVNSSVSISLTGCNIRNQSMKLQNAGEFVARPQLWYAHTGATSITSNTSNYFDRRDNSNVPPSLSNYAAYNGPVSGAASSRTENEIIGGSKHHVVNGTADINAPSILNTAVYSASSPVHDFTTQNSGDYIMRIGQADSATHQFKYGLGLKRNTNTGYIDFDFNQSINAFDLGLNLSANLKVNQFLYAVATYTFTITAASATLGAIYTDTTGQTFVVSQTISSGITLVTSGVFAPAASGTLTKQSGTGASTITYSAYSTSYALKTTTYGTTFGILTNKTTPVAADLFLASDSADSSLTKGVTGTNLISYVLGGLTVTDSSTIDFTYASPNLTATVIEAGLTLNNIGGTLGPTKGGTGITSYAQGDLLYSDATNSLAKLPKDANATRYLANTGTSNAPAWNQVNLTNGVTGVLPPANGGSGQSNSWPTGGVVYGAGAGILTANASLLKFNSSTTSLGINCDPGAMLDINGAGVTHIRFGDITSGTQFTYNMSRDTSGNFVVQANQTSFSPTFKFKDQPGTTYLAVDSTGISTGVWNATIISTAKGGTGVDNSTGGTANQFWARPNGSTGAATYRAIVAADVPTLNQNTTGSAATLTTARSIYGNNFDGSAALSQIIASTFGGTGNGFTKFSGPASSEKTFTLPNASATILTDNALVTAAQGGTGNGFFAVSGPTTSTKTFTFPNASATVLTSNAVVTIAQGGTNSTSFTSNRVPYISGSSFVDSANLTFDGTRLIVAGNSGDSTLRTGGLELESLSTTNQLVSGNIYWGSGWTRRAAGGGGSIQFLDSDIYFRHFGTDGGAGANSGATPIFGLTLLYNSGSGGLVIPGNRTSSIASNSSTTGTAGEIAWDANYIYVCTATNTWRRASLGVY